MLLFCKIIFFSSIVIFCLALICSGQTDQKATCPCVKNSRTNECIAYDSQYQASTVEEAMLFFPDLTNYKTKPVNNVDNTKRGRTQKALVHDTENVSGAGGPLGPTAPKGSEIPPPSLLSGGICDDETCKNCSDVLLNKLQRLGAVSPMEAFRIRKKFLLSPPGRLRKNTSECSEYRVDLNVIESPKEQPPKTTSGSKPRLSLSDPVINKNSSDSIATMLETLSTEGTTNWAKQNDIVKSRQIRAATVVGERYTIGCIKRGEPLDKTSDWISLCNMCWVWRKLPQDYFPQYINELLCDSDVKCLSGWGSCVQQYRNVDVLQNIGARGTTNWRAVSLESSNMCECSVKSGSALHNFIAS